MYSQKRRGFTLIEVLVLAVMIAVNLGLLTIGVERVHAAAVHAKDRQSLMQSVPVARGHNRVG